MRAVDQKLGLRDGMSLLLLNQPRANILGDLPSLPVIDREPQERIVVYDAIIVFAKSFAELEALLDTALPRYRTGGLLWICYAKQSSSVRGSLNCNVLMNAIDGFRPVSNIAVNEDWTALRYRRMEEVGS